MGAAVWSIWVGGECFGRYGTRRAAMNAWDRPWRRGRPMVQHDRTGERWERVARAWFKIQDCWPERGRA
jgi:hypothetical protein